MHKTCIVIPCYNEGKRLPVNKFLDFLGHNTYSIFFVNDGSKDDTLQVLNKIKDMYPDQVNVIDLPKNSGKGEAVRQGFLTAFKNERFHLVGYLDADLATPLEEIEYLLQHLQNDIKVVIGSRVQRLGAYIDRNLLRHYIGRVFATLASVTLDLKVYDSQCGAKIFEINTAKQLFAKPFESRWLFDLELIYRLKHIKGLDFNNTILEVPVRKWQEKGDTRIKIVDVINVPFHLLKIKRHTLDT